MPEQTAPGCTHHFQVDDIHTLEVKEYGSKSGTPVVFLHGGPGSGCRNSLCKLFDLKKFRIIAPDQRGAGNSTPKGCLENNTTQHLITDLDFIRQQLGIRKWLIAGGSWGALLALAYTETYPETVAGIAVRSLFLGTEQELENAFINLPKRLYPEIYQQFIQLLPEAERNTPLLSYYKRILDPAPEISLPASYVWHDYERLLSRLHPAPLSLPEKLALSEYDERPTPSTPRMEAHYFLNHCFLESDQLLEKSDRLAHIPGIIVQARYDLLCPPLMSRMLVERWPVAEVVMVEAAGHSVDEANVATTMKQSMDELNCRIQNCS